MWQAFPFKISEKYFYELPISGFPEAMILNEELLKTLKRKLCFPVRYKDAIIGVATVKIGMKFSIWNITDKPEKRNVALLLDAKIFPLQWWKRDVLRSKVD